ncbi:hypothetical protein L1D34_26735 [Vibrio mediterranei]|uniref:hypothetical protein n=1 Tax=Vibrio mediterranei TaxID=689 RepID=UPI001EFCFD2B|nr:hypothetical protein [Vibrio mediterranei]MCG9628415.1 hypothetical protein [Vibrio mediterranei]
MHELVVGEKAHAVFFSKEQGHNLRSRGIFHGALLVANLALTPIHGDIVIAALYYLPILARQYHTRKGDYRSHRDSVVKSP